MIKEQEKQGKAAEALFKRYLEEYYSHFSRGENVRIVDAKNGFDIDKISSFDEITIIDVSENRQWQDATDIDFILIKDHKPEFHEIKEQLRQFIGHYYNTTLEDQSLSDTGEKGFRCQEEKNRYSFRERRIYCEDCPEFQECNEYKKVKAPDQLKELLLLRGQNNLYKHEYCIKYGDGWLYKNPFVHADYYHFLFAFEFESYNEGTKTHSCVRHETEENINRLKQRITGKNEKIITRFPFDFFISVEHERLMKLLGKNKYTQESKPGRMKNGKTNRLLYLPICDVINALLWNLNDCSLQINEEIKITPIITCCDAKNSLEFAGINHFILNDKLIKESGFDFGEQERDIAFNTQMGGFYSKNRKRYESPAGILALALLHGNIERVFDL